MTKTKKLILVILFTIFIDDLCRYIKFFISDKSKRIIAFDLVVTRFNGGTVVNWSIIFLVTISIIYFVYSFLDTKN